MLSCFIHCRRLVARTLPFQGGEAGSIPVDSTKICRGGRLVMQRIVYPSYAGSIPVLGAKFISMKCYQVALAVWGGRVQVRIPAWRPS